MDLNIPPGLTPAATEAFLQIQLQLLLKESEAGRVVLLPPPQALAALVHPPAHPPTVPPPRVLAPASPLPEPVKESREPLLSGVMKIMSTKEALALMKNPTSFTSNLLDMYMAASGTVWLFQSKTKTTDTGDWRHVGHQ